MRRSRNIIGFITTGSMSRILLATTLSFMYEVILDLTYNHPKVCHCERADFQSEQRFLIIDNIGRQKRSCLLLPVAMPMIPFQLIRNNLYKAIKQETEKMGCFHIQRTRNILVPSRSQCIREKSACKTTRNTAMGKGIYNVAVVERYRGRVKK